MYTKAKVTNELCRRALKAEDKASLAMCCLTMVRVRSRVRLRFRDSVTVSVVLPSNCKVKC